MPAVEPGLYLQLAATSLVERLAAGGDPAALRAFSAVARAFLLVELLGAGAADEALADAELALALRGLPGGALESPALPPDGPAGRADALALGSDRSICPLIVVGCDLTCALVEADIHIPWLMPSPSGVRFPLSADNLRPRAGPSQDPVPSLADLAVADDAGRPYSAEWQDAGGRDGSWSGHASLLPQVPPDARWLELGPATGGDRTRVILEPCSPVPTGVEPSASSPAGRFLSQLLRWAGTGRGIADDPGPLATVLEALLAVGALEEGDELVQRARTLIGEGSTRTGGPPGTTPWASGPGPPGEGRHPTMAAGAILPFERLSVVVEGVIATGTGVALQLYAAPIFTKTAFAEDPPWLRAIDPSGREHLGWPTSSRWREGEWEGRVVLHPPEDVRRLHVVVETPFESAFADVEVPGR